MSAVVSIWSKVEVDGKDSLTTTVKVPDDEATGSRRFVGACCSLLASETASKLSGSGPGEVVPLVETFAHLLGRDPLWRLEPYEHLTGPRHSGAADGTAARHVLALRVLALVRRNDRCGGARRRRRDVGPVPRR